MNYLKLGFLSFGLLLFGLVVRDLDLLDVARQVAQVGASGILAVVLLYAVTFGADVAGWQLTLSNVPLDLRWLGRLYGVRMLGEAFNNVTPFAAMGGEPVKAYILKAHYGIGYRDSGVSLILAKTVILLALVLFLTIGFWMLAPTDGLHASHKTIAWIGYLGLGLGIVLFYLIQRFRAASWLGRYLGASALALRLSKILSVIHEVDDRLARFYTEQRGRFAGAFLLALANWLLGVTEVYLVMWLLGHPISFTDAWIIESLAQLVRAGTPFIPGSLGAQEGTLTLACAAITGNPGVGLALSFVRRARELIWVLGGLGLWWTYSANGRLSPDKTRAVGSEATVP